MLDLMLLGVDGLEICKCVCVMVCYILIIIISVWVSEVYCIFGLELGVDDYLVKLFLMLELVVWVKVLLCWVEVMVFNVCIDVGELDVVGICIDLVVCIV